MRGAYAIKSNGSVTRTLLPRQRFCASALRFLGGQSRRHDGTGGPCGGGGLVVAALAWLARVHLESSTPASVSPGVLMSSKISTD
jgi:hypothetical protein